MGAKKKSQIQAENQTHPEHDADENAQTAAEDPKVALEAKVEAAERKAQETYDRLLRVSADLENYKKRTARDMTDFRKFANESLIKALLPVVDNLERALVSASNNQPAGNSIVEGVQMTLAEIFKIFEQFNIQPIESLEKPFDPGFHQAVMQEENDDHPDKTVINELQKGYLMHDRLIRPAMVVVSKKKETPVEREKDVQPGDNQQEN